MDDELCKYCTDTVTGLPGNACENCMNTGSANPEPRVDDNGALVEMLISLMAIAYPGKLSPPDAPVCYRLAQGAIHRAQKRMTPAQLAHPKSRRC